MSTGYLKLDVDDCIRKEMLAAVSRPYDDWKAGLAPESESLSRSEVSGLERGRERETLEQVFPTPCSPSSAELVRVLDEVRSKFADGRMDVAQRRTMDRLLVRAIRCAMRQGRLQTELSNFAVTDELTGLYNRRGFSLLGERQLKLAHRSGREILVFFADVDRLKQINDKLGHAEGDRALVRAARVLQMTFRDSDVIARLGGDEFVILAVEVTGESAATIRARLEENLMYVNAEDPRYILSIRTGVARFDPTNLRGAASIEQLMIRADEAMYEEKRRGSKFIQGLRQRAG